MHNKGDMMAFGEELSLLVIDKIIIAGIAFYLWHLYQKNQEKEKEQVKKRKDLEDQIRQLSEDRRETELRERITLLEQQLDRFYWPISLYMKNDDAVWQRVPSLHEDGTQLPTEAGSSVEKEFLLPNHEKAVKVIEENFHLIGENEALIQELLKYIRHVAVFKSLRLSRSDLNPIDVDEPFPTRLVELVETEIKNKREELDDLRTQRWRIERGHLARD